MFKSLVVLALMVGLCLSLHITNVEVQQFHEWKQKFARSYPNATEEAYRLTVFAKNLEIINRHNSNKNKRFGMAMNQFGDLDHSEFVQLYLSKPPLTYSLSIPAKAEIRTIGDLPSKIDWRGKAVTDVKDQGQCGSCWAFSTSGAVEGAHYMATQKLVSLSEQQMLDCDYHKGGNEGCDGGDMRLALGYVAQSGLMAERDYEYEASKGKCKYNAAKVAATITAYVNVTQGDEDALSDAVANHGPVSIGMDASQDSFQFYSWGIYEDPGCGNKPGDIDHGVLAVGYEKDKSLDWWIVKNSWGDSWGESGYIRIARHAKNMCGVATFAQYAVVSA